MWTDIMKKMIEKKDKTSSEDVLEINLIPLLLHLLKKIWIILLVALVCGALAFSATKLFIKPTYRCGFTAYVNNKLATKDSDLLTASDVNAAKEIVKTYANILKSNTVLASADEAFDINYSVEELKKMIQTEIQSETEIIQVFAIAKSPEEAYAIASAVASTAPGIMADIVEGSSMKIVEYPQVPKEIYQPSYVKYAAVGFLIGFLLAAAFFTIRYLMDDTITDESELETRLNATVLGVIPDVFARSSGKSKYYYNYYYEKSDSEKGAEDNEKA